MKTCTLFNIASVLALTASLLLTNAKSVMAETVTINPDFQPDPMVLNGKSGGPKSSDCGKISATPNQIIQVTKPLPYLKLAVTSNGKPTLLIEGPGGRFCVLPDNYSGDKPEISGFWQPGKYLLYVGELVDGEHTYTLSISKQKN
ncbi:hypothetical protein CEN41_06265 [Fischerella thermalis CCMEE 5330]|uniref:Uncharacterized protein n=1 Tax=Fischerella thermalis CCMEE 5330 TaxID=2019670 RepID=A0A2N6MHI6_9CYAN|nr:hypothetical protein [Fischerella thermalis]PMB46215.1 hypothetical protein CEN41_06265 [Fischerella thermalis CCMEE 5330]